MKLRIFAIFSLLVGIAFIASCSGNSSPSTPTTSGSTYYYANWTCSGQASCIAVMGANLGSAGPFCSQQDANNWGNQYIPGSYNTSTSPQYAVLHSPPAGTCQTWGSSSVTNTFTPTPGSPTATPTINLQTITPTATLTFTRSPTPNPSWTPTMTPTSTPTGTVTPNSYINQLSCSGLTSPYGLAVDNSGNIFITDRTGTVYKFPGIGASSPSATLVISGATTLGHVAVDSSGNVYIVESAAQSMVWQYDNNLASTVGPVSYAAGLNQPNGVAVDPAGNVYVSDIWISDAPSFVVKYNSQAVSQLTIRDNASLTWLKPYGIASNSAGTSIYAACSNYVFFTPDAPGAYNYYSGLNSPQGVAVDPVSGDVYFADTGNNQVVRYDQTMATLKGTVGSGFSGPTDVAVDFAGNVYVLDSGHKKVMMYSP